MQTHVMDFEWDNVEHFAEIGKLGLGVDGKWDVILGADVVFQSFCVPALFNTVKVRDGPGLLNQSLFHGLHPRHKSAFKLPSFF
jgi:hypothetical protein